MNVLKRRDTPFFKGEIRDNDTASLFTGSLLRNINTCMAGSTNSRPAVRGTPMAQSLNSTDVMEFEIAAEMGVMGTAPPFDLFTAGDEP